MAAKRLRAVSADEKPPTPKQVRSVLQASDAGDRRALLVAMRTRIAKAIDDAGTPARDLAALTRRQLEIAREIEAIDLSTGSAESVVASTDDEAWDGSTH